MMIIELDLTKSTFPVLSRVIAQYEIGRRDLSYLREWTVNNSHKCEAAILNIDKRAASSGDYWILFVAGYDEYSSSGKIDGANCFARYLKRLYEATRYDPGLQTEFDNDEILFSRIQRRFQTLNKYEIGGFADDLPIALYVPTEHGTPCPFVAQTSDRKYVAYQRLDGYHRLFSSIVTQHKTIQATIEVEPRIPTVGI